ncbi:GNAT family protein [Paenibacillus aurantius]|uniref:GNAT family protein n=1 Tax=Paenibacillus aurantius TaxID=2918900 RepID=A0AA96RDY5_9BACL|nr:GNAT family protein [Paenibacillus aurantius]WNQ09926.1 GNAT family protein [Paenibacillus aurantius]
MFKYKVDDRLYLAQLETGHAEELFQLTVRNREHLGEWLPFAHATHRVEDTLAYLESCRVRHEAQDGLSAGIWREGQLVGTIGLHDYNRDNRRVEIGYWLSEDCCGQGIMTRACRVLINYVFSDLEFNRVQIKAAVGNLPSRAIPERLGFTQEGTLRDYSFLNGHYVDMAVYGMLRREWTKGVYNGRTASGTQEGKVI